MSTQGRVTVTDRSAEFIRANERAIDDALNLGAKHIKIMAEAKVPKRSLNLMKRITYKRVKRLHWQVRVDEDYAAYQERGMRADGSHVVKKYTTPGTGAHYLEKSGDYIAQRFVSYFRNAIRKM